MLRITSFLEKFRIIDKHYTSEKRALIASAEKFGIILAEQDVIIKRGVATLPSLSAAAKSTIYLNKGVIIKEVKARYSFSHLIDIH